MNRNREPKGAETGGQFTAGINPESTIDLGVIEVDLDYLFDDVGYVGTITLVPDTSRDVDIVALTQ